MIKIFKKEIVASKYDDFVKDEIVVDNICLAVPYDNKCDIFLANGIKITVAKEVYNRIVENAIDDKNRLTEEKDKGNNESLVKKIGKKFKK